MDPRTALAALGIVAALIPDPAGAQTPDTLFNGDVLHELRLFVNERDLGELRDHYAENTYYPADLHWGAFRVRNVGIRSRGNGSRNPHKLGLKIDFDKYVTGQRLRGFESLVLDNLWQDPSMVRERVAMALFEKLGQPASREVFARVYINERYEGLYAVVEPVDADYLERHIDDRAAHLFEYRWREPYGFEDLGDDLSRYQRLWEAETHSRDPMGVLYSPIREMVRAIGGPVDRAWRSQVERYVDLPQVVTHAAIEAFMAEGDGLLGEWGMNNLYLYRPSGTVQHRVIAWDRDHAFQAADTSVFRRLGDNRLLAGALAFADLRATYLAVLQRCAEVAHRDDWLERTVLESASLIDWAAREDVRKPYDNEAHAHAVASLVAFARERPRHVLAEIGPDRTE
jgi:spore coat protein CotH